MKKILKHITRIIIPHKFLMLIIFIVCLFSMAEGFFQPIIVQKLTDDGMLQLNFRVILLYGGALILLIIVIQALEILQSWLLLRVRNDVLHKLHNQAFEKITHLEINYFTEKNSAEIINQLNTDIENVGTLFSKGFIYIFTYALRIVSGIFGLFYINWQMTLCILMCIPVKLVFLQIFSRKKENMYASFINDNRQLYSWVSDRIMGIREIKLLNRYEKDIEIYSNKREKLLKKFQNINMLDIWNTSIEALIFGIMTGIYYLIGGYFVCKGVLSMGKVLAFITYSNNVTTPISIVMNIKMVVAQIRPSLERLQKFFELHVENDTHQPYVDTINTIEVTNVSFGYRKKYIINHAFMTMKMGERIAIIGENGSGKSTMIQILLRLYEPDSGKILIDGKNYLSVNLKSYRGFFSVVTQNAYLFHETIRENLDYFGTYSDEDIIQTFSDLGMKDLYNQFPDGLDTIVGVDGANLSGGERQKLVFVRAILRKSPIFIFDESTSNLDEESEKWFFTKGLDLIRDKLVILITHQTCYIEKFDKIYVMENGKPVLKVS